MWNEICDFVDLEEIWLWKLGSAGNILVFTEIILAEVLGKGDFVGFAENLLAELSDKGGLYVSKVTRNPWSPPPNGKVHKSL